MLIVKNLNLLEDYGFKKERQGVYYYKSKHFFLWVNPYLMKKELNKNQLILEYFDDEAEDDMLQEYAEDNMLMVIYRLINDGVVEVEA